jgi:hypothetical protein
MNLKSKLKTNLKAFYGILLLSVVFSCGSNEGKFIISNESDFDIDSLYILPDSKKQIIKIAKGEHVNHDIKMNKVESDGSYFISFRNSETKKIRFTSFGYYTNGYQVEDNIRIKILNDTIMISSNFDDIF